MPDRASRRRQDTRSRELVGRLRGGPKRDRSYCGHPGSHHTAPARATEVAVATLIDASLLIAAERGRLDWDEIVAAHAEEEVAVAAITASVLLHGVHRATDPKVRHAA